MEIGALKLIAIIPSEPVYSVVKNEQAYIAEQWGPKHALRTPPHITIIPPLALDKMQVSALYPFGEMIASLMKPFVMRLHGYGAFKPRVVFIQPEIPDELQQLHDIWRKILLQKMPVVLDKYPDRPYHPHMTLAHKDVTSRQFHEMWPYYRDKVFSASFEVKSFWILNHASDGWIPEKEFNFGRLLEQAPTTAIHS